MTRTIPNPVPSRCSPNWHCDVCGDLRPDDKIDVAKCDASEAYGLPGGVLTINTKFCNDRRECEVLARSVRLPGELRIVHFDWAPDAIQAGTSPKCSLKGFKTLSLRAVTCPGCREFIDQMVGAWARGRRG